MPDSVSAFFIFASQSFAISKIMQQWFMENKLEIIYVNEDY